MLHTTTYSATVFSASSNQHFQPRKDRAVARPLFSPRFRFSKRLVWENLGAKHQVCHQIGQNKLPHKSRLSRTLSSQLILRNTKDPLPPSQYQPRRLQSEPQSKASLEFRREARNTDQKRLR
ncbi:hypothetical protein LZ554_006300 [Drepanopeziza brunnea f. sp. 'monogermtubi']|nr:hypothetical protein LZ554_006300 [Drepanopeziza brunnea f. sp. 'monogermtubi']